MVLHAYGPASKNAVYLSLLIKILNSKHRIFNPNGSGIILLAVAIMQFPKHQKWYINEQWNCGGKVNSLEDSENENSNPSHRKPVSGPITMRAMKKRPDNGNS